MSNLTYILKKALLESERSDSEYRTKYIVKELIEDLRREFGNDLFKEEE